jgi:hypothetical protein
MPAPKKLSSVLNRTLKRGAAGFGVSIFNAGANAGFARLVIDSGDGEVDVMPPVPSDLIVFPDMLVIDNIAGPDDVVIQFRINGKKCTKSGASTGAASTPPVQIIPPLGPGEQLTAEMISGTGPATVLISLSSVEAANRGVQRTTLSTAATPTKVLDSPASGKARVALGISGLEPITALAYFFNEDGSSTNVLMLKSTDGGVTGDTWNSVLVNGGSQSAAATPVLLQGDELFVAQDNAGVLNAFLAYHDVDTIF